MRLFGKNIEEKEETVNDLIDDNIKKYLSYRKDLYSIYGIRYSQEDKVKMTDSFKNSIAYFKRYMESTFSDDVLINGNVANIDEEDMLSKAPVDAKSLFVSPRYDSIIYLNDSSHFPHIHTDGANVEELEGLSSMPGLKPIIQNIGLEKIFEGQSVEVTEALLSQMSLLPLENDLKKAIVAKKIKTKERVLFFKSIILAILDSDSELRVNRARLFADTFNVDFLFEKYEQEVMKQKALKKEI